MKNTERRVIRKSIVAFFTGNKDTTYECPMNCEVIIIYFLPDKDLYIQNNINNIL